ncbi:MAG: DUF3106 domain-containing protein [Pseudomonadota bacterium]
MRPRPVVVAVAVLLASALAHARVPDDFRRVLALLQPVQRERLQDQARQWSRWTPAQRAGFARRAAAWDALPLVERRRRREAWSAWRMLTADERMRLRGEAARLAALAPGKRAALRQRFASLDATTQRGWMLGPALGADYARLQPLLAHAPAAQHAALLRSLRAMTPLQRADLAVLVQRTPPADRDRLRRELVSTSDANRAAWLQLSLER